LALDDGTTDAAYLKALKYELPRHVDNFEPDFIFYLAGVDVLKNDKLGRLSLSIQGCKERDRFVLDLCKRNNIPLQISMGGGYSIYLKEIIDAHSNTFELAQELYF
jgi:acetoin utilization deacetylase AcuC-like enzyme